MNRGITYALSLIVLLAGGPVMGTYAQSRYDSAYNEIAKSYAENLVVFTDRTLYAVNESILFSALLQSGEEPYHGTGSTVLYAELVNAAGTAVTSGKYPIEKNWSGGHLSIPSSLESGIYYLRCYTRWMRNFGPRDFAYIPVRVVNPYSGNSRTGRPEAGKNNLLEVHKGNRIITPSPSRESYRTGETVEVEISLDEDSNTRIHHACITVVPSGAIESSVFKYKVNPEPGERDSFQFDFLPETKGTSISGVVLEHSSQKAASDTRIHFSILGEEPAYFVSQSDKEGGFQVNTPLRVGEQEMFVVPDYQPGDPLEVRIDNDFSSAALPFYPDSLELNHEEYLLASRVALNMQMERTFLADSGSESANLAYQADSLPFYGTPEISVKMDEFISLPNMEEVIVNLIPNTYVVNREGRTHFVIKSDNPMISQFPPLILMDHIPVFDMDAIMAIPPSKIGYIDVIPELYVLGGVKFGGIISFTSLHGDLASIKLPEGSYFFDYTGFQAPLVPQAARYSAQGRIPDTRNTLFWMDRCELSKDKSLIISFQSAAIPGSYLILIRGVSSRGDIVYGLNQFKVE